MEIPAGVVNIITAVVTATTTLVVVFVTNRLALFRSSKEKLWDLKRQVYGQILSELADAERVLDVANEFIVERGYEYYHGTEYYSKHQSKLFDHLFSIRKKFSDDYLILSDSFIELFQKLSDELFLDEPNEDPPERHERIEGAVKKYRPLLTTQARNELNIPKSWWQSS
jgi:hypothetical protein